MAGKTLVALILLALGAAQCPLFGQLATPQNQPVAEYGVATSWQSELEFAPGRTGLFKAWEASVGTGRGQVVGDRKTVFLTTGRSEKAEPKGKTKVSTYLLALDLQSGQKKWRYSFEPSVLGDDQETFGGADASPNATPAIIDGRVIAISFTGQLVCLNQVDGTPCWEKDLVEECGADPVQFGFSSSPVIDKFHPGRILVFAGGKNGGLLNIDVQSGDLVWKCDVDSFSYATPIPAKLGGLHQWIVVSQNEVIGVGTKDGKQLWSYPIPKPGLTNVPTPMLLNGGLIFSGQGFGGTRRFDVSRLGEQWSVEEKWHQRRLEYFYTNCRTLNSDKLIGCVDQFLTVVDTKDGSLLGKWRGFENGNILATKGGLIVVNGQGKLSLLVSNSAPHELQCSDEYQLVEGRCWTPPTVIDDHVIVRFDDRVSCFRLTSDEGIESLVNLAKSPRTLAFKKTADTVADPVEAIFDAFQSQGQAAALKLYSELRSAGKLSAEQRVALATAAKQQGLKELATMILEHARDDLPNALMIQRAIKQFKE